MRSELELADERLVLLSKDGDLDAFNRLVERYQRSVYSLCYRLLGHREAAEDAAQETFLSAFRSISRFEGGSVRSWLLRIAANASKDELRRRGRKDRAASLDQIFDTFDAPVEVADAGPGVEQLVVDGELSEAFQRALHELPLDQRQALLLLDVHGYHYEEIAQITGASLGTVKSRIHRGRERLRIIIAARPELFTLVRRLDE